MLDLKVMGDSDRKLVALVAISYVTKLADAKMGVIVSQACPTVLIATPASFKTKSSECFRICKFCVNCDGFYSLRRGKLSESAFGAGSRSPTVITRLYNR